MEETTSKPSGDAATVLNADSAACGKPFPDDIPASHPGSQRPWPFYGAVAAIALAAGTALLVWILSDPLGPSIGRWFEETFLYRSFTAHPDGSPSVVYDGVAYDEEVGVNYPLLALYAMGGTVALVAICWTVFTLTCRRAIRDAVARERAATVRSAAQCTAAFLSGTAAAADVFPPALLPLAAVVEGERAERQREQRLAHEEAERKSDLVACLAHDLRTPLTSIVGYGDMLAEDPAMPLERRIRYAHAVRDKGLRLEGLIGELFEIARYDLQHLELERGTVDLAVLFDQLIEEMYPMATAHGNSIAASIPPDALIKGDAGKLARAFGNVLRNAIAYSYVGTPIDVRAAMGDDRVEITITNRGATIPARKLTSIFDRFYRLDEARTSTAGGSGLGLAITREIIERHGGAVEAASAEEKTTFTLRLPQA